MAPDGFQSTEVLALNGRLGRESAVIRHKMQNGFGDATALINLAYSDLDRRRVLEAGQPAPDGFQATEALSLNERLGRESADIRQEMHDGFGDTTALINFADSELTVRPRPPQGGLLAI